MPWLASLLCFTKNVVKRLLFLQTTSYRISSDFEALTHFEGQGLRTHQKHIQVLNSLLSLLCDHILINLNIINRSSILRRDFCCRYRGFRFSTK
ncbi:protein of unknown function [Legionella micdadei]|uniref:Uncharacterized protein n=1 Tax=Legionella micdadei TaxID=451 RepID=A0A098GFM2_LEGMI|nr:protein of unknown function [Legionella micdadei]